VSAVFADVAAPVCARAVIRDAALSDAVAVAGIYNDSIEPSGRHLRSVGSVPPTNDAAPRAPERGALLPLSTEGAQRWMQLHVESGRALWIACRDGEPVGWLSFLGLSDRPGMAYSSELAIYVSASARGSGIGSTLLTAAVRQAPALGLDHLLAMVWSDNAASLQLFRRHGFVPWGRLPAVVWAAGASHDMFVLGRRALAAPQAR
jgi:L-amino acid N-acyltransferase YncA